MPTGATARVHGVDGPIHVTFIPNPNRLNQAFLDAFAALGAYRHCDDFTGLDPEGYRTSPGHDSSRPVGIPPRDAMLMPALPRPNLTVLTRTAVTGIRIEAGRATGVDVSAAAGQRRDARLHARSCCAPARFTRPSC